MAEIEGLPPSGPLTVEAFGNTYEVAEKVSQMPLMRFAHLAKRGKGTADMEALDAMYEVIRGVFTDESFAQFEQDACDARADADDLFGVVSAAIQATAARPTGRPSDSSPGPLTTTPSSTESSSFEDRKRALGLVPVMDAVQELTG